MSRIVRYTLVAVPIMMLLEVHMRIAKETDEDAGKVSIYEARTGKVVLVDRVTRTDAEWKRILSPEQYRVTRRKGTEAPFTGSCAVGKDGGVYRCVCCGTDLFGVPKKYESGSGWPSFWEPVSELNVKEERDTSLGMERTEVLCARCGAHLGHVFDDGPEPTGKRYCINAAALELAPPEPRKATFAAGCFWGVEESFRMMPGVLATRVGYTGGKTKNPTYEQVCSDQTGHAESIEIVYDPTRTTYAKLLEKFWSIHDPTTPDRQGPDIGSQYRSAIFVHDEEQRKEALASKEALGKSGRFTTKIVTEIVPAGEFYPAEEYHQRYYMKEGIEACPR